jgi:hypothetical protein
MAVQHQHEWPTNVIGGAPRPAVVIDQIDRRNDVTDAEGHAPSLPVFSRGA